MFSTLSSQQKFKLLILQHTNTDFDVFIRLSQIGTVNTVVPTAEAVSVAVFKRESLLMNVDYSTFYSWVVKNFVVKGVEPHKDRKGCPYKRGEFVCTSIVNSGIVQSLDNLLDQMAHSNEALAKTFQQLLFVTVLIRGREGNLQHGMEKITTAVKGEHELQALRWKSLISHVLLPEAIDSISWDDPTTSSAWVGTWLRSIDDLLSESIARSVTTWIEGILLQARTTGRSYQTNVTLLRFETYISEKTRAGQLRMAGGSVTVWENEYYALLRESRMAFETEAARYVGTPPSTTFQLDLLKRLVTEGIPKVAVPIDICASSPKCNSLQTLVNVVQSYSNRRTLEVVATLLQAPMKDWGFLSPLDLLSDLSKTLPTRTGNRMLEALPTVLNLVDGALHTTSTNQSGLRVKCLSDAAHLQLQTLATGLSELEKVRGPSDALRSAIEHLKRWKSCRDQWWHLPAAIAAVVIVLSTVIFFEQ